MIPSTRTPRVEVCILAGGLSTRMGRDKSRLRIGPRRLLTHVRRAALAAGVGRVHTLRRDLVPRCGPLGGFISALRTTRAGAVLFLACDMPFVTPALLRRLVRASRGGRRAVAAAQEGLGGFPLLLPVAALPAVERQVADGDFSLQHLLGILSAHRVALAPGSRLIFNINTPEEAEAATARLKRRDGRRAATGA